MEHICKFRPYPISDRSHRQRSSWKNFGTSMNAIAFGFVATAILISMFLIMAIFEHLFRPNPPFSSPQEVINRSLESGPVDKLGNPQPRRFSVKCLIEMLHGIPRLLGSLHRVYYDETVQLLVRMQKDFISPNSSSIVAVLPAVAQASALRNGKAIHGFCVGEGCIDDVVVARRNFDRMSMENVST
ncbi:hypothetical protein GH714_005648 [Hevea brasiliensis]|uniref:Uncharacterized protein n=1 Tax=Hevea brasiliensis TaxID=3981 RepID=A0A6A6L0S8_HEVBR|nr:hypothetical protein GH714_005648 [Hevea brasiliensis]